MTITPLTFSFFLFYEYDLYFFFSFLEFHNLWRSFLLITLYYQIKISFDFLCRWELNIRFLIQLSETLPVELTETHRQPLLK